MGRKVWNQESLGLLAAEFEGGMKVAEMAQRHNLSRIRIYQLLKQAGVQIKTRKNDSGVPESVPTQV